jgi:hypothetical protein
LVEQRIENPRVGGSIPPQATKLHAPQRPFRVLGRFYNRAELSTKEGLAVLSLIGRRYERLLFFAGPIAFACILVMFVALASEGHEDHRLARCLRQAADVIEEHQEALLRAYWGERTSIRGHTTKDYELALTYVLIPWEIGNRSCERRMVKHESDKRTLAPQPLVQLLRKQAQELVSRPLNMYGVELPDKATISALGTPVRMDLVTMSRVLQVSLGPVLLLWLGSLYNTRHRESLQIARLRDVARLYPHLVNVYPVMLQGDTTWDEPKRKSWSRYFWLAYGVPALYSVVRIFLLSAFIGPPVAFYLVSLYLLGSGPYSAVFVVAGALVAVFTVGNFLGELMPWHVRKQFRVGSNGPI